MLILFYSTCWHHGNVPGNILPYHFAICEFWSIPDLSMNICSYNLASPRTPRYGFAKRFLRILLLNINHIYRPSSRDYKQNRASLWICTTECSFERRCKSSGALLHTCMCGCAVVVCVCMWLPACDCVCVCDNNIAKKWCCSCHMEYDQSAWLELNHKKTRRLSLEMCAQFQ